MPTTLLRVRVDCARAREADRIFSKIGLKPSVAFNIFLAKVVAVRGLPFPVDDSLLPHTPNAETVAALNDKAARKFKDVKSALAWLRDKQD